MVALLCKELTTDMRPDKFRLLTLLGVAIATLSLTACGSRSGREVDSRFTKAETLMEEHPDSALALLDNIRCPLPGSTD